MNPVSGTVKNKITSLLTGLAITILFITVLEVGFRALDRILHFLPPGPPSWVRFSPSLHFEIQPNFRGMLFDTPVSTNSYGLRGPEFALDKADTFRIVCLGNSCAFGYGQPAKSAFPAQLEEILRDKFSAKIQVINAGIPGYSSYQGLVYLREKALLFQPDLLIVSFGYNDRRAIPDISWSDSPQFFSRDYRAHRRIEFFRKSYIYRFFQHLAPKSIPIKGFDVRVDTLRFADNLSQIARIASENDIPAIFLGIPDNPRYLTAFYRAETLIEEGKIYRARETLEKVNGHFARMGRKRFNQRIEELGLRVEPLSDPGEEMSFHGGLPVFTGEVYNSIMEQVALQNGMEYLELGDALGIERYLDFIHLNTQGGRKTAEKLCEVIAVNGYICDRSEYLD